MVNYRETADLAAAIRALGRADVALDCVGGPYLDAHLQCLNQDGRLVVIGVMGGAQATLNLGLLLVKRIRVMGSTLRSQPLRAGRRWRARWLNISCRRLCAVSCAGRWIGSRPARRRPGACLGGGPRGR